jgi:uncharacterized protein YndB with AHSA1/START domain
MHCGPDYDMARFGEAMRCHRAVDFATSDPSSIGGADNGAASITHTEQPMKITVETLARTDLETAWSAYNTPSDITQWNSPSEDWHSPRSQVDLRDGGSFNTRMEAKDGSMGFDFEGTYTNVVPQQLIEYRMGDGREVAVHFDQTEDGVRVRTVFDAESENSAEVQQQGWQAILDNFGRYAEANISTG